MPSCLLHEVYADIPECAEHIALSQAFAQIIAVDCDVDPFDHDALREQLSTPSPSRELLRCFTRALQSGKLRAFSRPIGGGMLKALPREHWNADDVIGRFVTSRYSRSKPFEPSAEADTWIFVSESEFAALWEELQERVLGSQVPRIQCHQKKPPKETRTVQSESQLLRLEAVEVIVGLGRSSIYKLMKEEAFPAQLKIGKRALWRRKDIDGWISLLKPDSIRAKTEEQDRPARSRTSGRLSGVVR